MAIYKNQQRLVVFQSLLLSGQPNTTNQPTVQLFYDNPDTVITASGTAQHVANGCWKILLTASELNHDVVSLIATASNSVPSQREIYTESDWSSARAARLDNLDAAVSSRSTFAGGTVTVAGYSAGQDPAALLASAGFTSARAARLDNLDAAVSSRSTFAGGTVTVGGYVPGLDPTSQMAAAGYDGVRAAKLDYLDAAVSSRSTYSGADTPGTDALLQRLTNTRASNLDRIDATVSSRMSGASYVAPPTSAGLAAAILTNPANKLGTDAQGRVSIDLAQAIPLVNAPQSVGDALSAARAQGFGAWRLDSAAKTLTLFAPDGVTTVRVFNLDSSTAPTTRT